MPKTYVYNGKEVFKTGRDAISKGTRNRVTMLLEVLPVKYMGLDLPVDYDVAEWVREVDLFEINK